MVAVPALRWRQTLSSTQEHEGLIRRPRPAPPPGRAHLQPGRVRALPRPPHPPWRSALLLAQSNGQLPHGLSSPLLTPQLHPLRLHDDARRHAWGGAAAGGGGDHVSSSTFPRMHYSSQYYDTATRDDCAAAASVSVAAVTSSSSSHHVGSSAKSNRIPANLLEQFEKAAAPAPRRLPHAAVPAGVGHSRRGRRTTQRKPRTHSPPRPLCPEALHQVPFAGGLVQDERHQGGGRRRGAGDITTMATGTTRSTAARGARARSASTDRAWAAGGAPTTTWTATAPTARPASWAAHHPDHTGHCYPESMQGHHFGDLTLKTSKSNNDVKCSACEGLAMAPEGKFMKRSSWSTLTVSQAKEAYRKSSLNLEKPMMHQDLKPSLRPCHYLQVSPLWF